MISVVILTLFLVGIFYRSHTDRKNLHKPFYIRFQRVLLLLAITLVPVLGMNLLMPEQGSRSESDILEEQIEKGSSIEIRTLAYERLFDMYPDSIPLRFDFIEMYVHGFSYPCDALLERDYSNNPHVDSIAKDYARSACSNLYYVESSFDYTQLTIEPKKERFNAFVRGIQAYHIGDDKRAERLFLEEIAINPSFDRTYRKLFTLYTIYDQNKVKSFLKNKNYRKHLHPSTQREYYYAYGMMAPYLGVLLERTFSNIDLFAFVSALVIAIVWLIFLRSMDVYNKERWTDILLVFLGGALFTNLCLPIYDFFHQTIGLIPNGKGLNDFIYCTTVIGVAEETVKLIPWLLFAMFSKKMKEPYDYLLYASVSALGFAFVENWSYLENPGNIVIRSMMSTTGHMFDASLVAYGFVLARYKAKKRHWKMLLPIAGFVAACLSHGFYDFWLISHAVSGYYMLTVLFFLLTLHIWFYLHNNAINNSKFYRKATFNHEKQLDVLTYGIIGILMIEYLIIGLKYGSSRANSAFSYDGWMVFVFLTYMSIIITHLEIIPGRWRRYSIALPRPFRRFARSFSLPTGTSTKKASHIGLDLRIFVRKSNKYVAKSFPTTGRCIEELTISGRDGWYLLELNHPISFNGHRSDAVVIRVKNPEHALSMDKEEIVLLFIPLGKDLSLKLQDSELTFTGRAFSRPI